LQTCDGFLVKTSGGEMSKKAILALCIAVIIPVLCYYAVKWTSEENVILPRRFYIDTVITKTVNGKTTDDTVWHKTANITLVNQLGDTVSLYDIQNKVIVADFFFTRCPSICPALTRNMARLQQSFSHYNQGRKVIDSSIVRFISFTVDPERDSVKQLKNYADRFGVDHDNWWMLTGNKRTIYDFILKEIKLPSEDGGSVDSNFVHSDRFVLFDRDKVIRGYYNGLDTSSLSRLAKDIGLLMLEKDKKKKRNLFRK
jgi:protein SCO1/2